MGDPVRTLFIALAMFCCVGSAAQAQEFPPVYVSIEEDDKDSGDCQVSTASSKAAVESELRYNRIPVGTKAQFISDEALQARAQTGVLAISGGCAVSYIFSLSNFQEVVLSITGKEMWAKVEICRLAGIMSGPSYNMQSRLNAAFRDYTSQCISEYRKKSDNLE